MLEDGSDETIEGCLIDIGFTRGQIKDFMNKYKNHELKEMLYFLEIHRRKILDGVHQEQKKIDYLDYLVYSLKKEVRVYE